MPYRTFLQDLANASEPAAAAEVFCQMVRALDATAAALIEAPHPIARPDICLTPHASLPRAAKGAEPRILASHGSKRFWSDYLELCRNRRDLVSRILHISPHVLTLSDISRHPRLARRAAPLETVLTRHRMNDLLAVPGIGHTAPQTIAVITGRNLALRRARRHLFARAAINAFTRILELSKPPPAPATDTDHRQKLTRRQLEIAHWLVAGKTDWEIGEILQISHKTVNYHVENMKRRYGVHSRNQFVAAIVHEGGLAPRHDLPHDKPGAA